MNNIEQEIRENIALENICLAKLNFVKNELLPVYGNVTLKEIEDCLWDQYLKFHNKVSNYFKEND